MRGWRGIAISLCWLLAALPALLPAQLRPHSHIEAHTTDSGTSHTDCSICGVPVLLDELPGFEIPAPLLRQLRIVFVPQFPEYPAPCSSRAGSRAPPAVS
jgi:hypothetical protein